MCYDAFGVNLDSSVHFKTNAAILFMDQWYLKTEYGKDTYRIYCEDNELDLNDNESKESFVDSYENDIYCRSGIEGLLVDYINDYDCNHKNIFTYDDFCIAVPATIPENEEDKQNLLTQEDIIKILQKYLSVLLTEDSPCNIQWLTINDL